MIAAWDVLGFTLLDPAFLVGIPLLLVLGALRHLREGAALPAAQTALFADLANGKVKSLRRLYGDNFLIDESVWEGTAPGRPFGIQGRGRPLKFRLLHVLEFADDGQIKRENVWVDLAAIHQQLP